MRLTAALKLWLAGLLSTNVAAAGFVCPASVDYDCGYGAQGIASSTNLTAGADWRVCCELCGEMPSCVAFTFLPKTPLPLCELRNALSSRNVSRPGSGKVSGVMPASPSPLPTPRPSPPPAPPGTQKNIIFITTDDQDLVLGSMQAMPNAGRLLRDGGANLTNFFTHTPICCPSRTTMLSGRYQHNNRVSGPSAPGCMRQNTSRVDNPRFWEDSFVRRLHDEHGYATGLFGKVLNSMGSYGCDGNSGLPPGVDRSYVMCTHNFFNNTWVDQDTIVFTGDDSRAPAGGGQYVSNYTTSVMANKSIEWIESVLAQGPTHSPFFAWIGPHAPHLPATPAPWYAAHPVGLNTAPRGDPYYNYSGRDKHSFIATEPIIDDADAAAIDVEYAKRLRSLLSVDDMIAGLAHALTRAGAWDATYVLFTSDHGYSQGQFRLCSHKMQVYDHGVRVPALVRGPGITPGSTVPAVTSMVDIAPTILEFAAGAGAVPTTMDGHSLAPLLLGGARGAAAAAGWRDSALIEYQSIAQKGVGPGHLKHPVDGVNNTFRALRVMNASHNLMYAEFTDVSKAADWNFPDASLNFFELYNVTDDHFMLENIYASADQELKDRLHAQLRAQFNCKGQAECR